MNEASPLASLTPVQIKQLQRVFYALDKNADGRVSDSDVAEALRNLGVKDAEAEAKTCFEGAPSSTYETMSFLTMMSGVMEPFQTHGNCRRHLKALMRKTRDSST